MRDSERELLTSGAKELGIELGGARADALLQLVDELELGNAQFNLTAIRDRPGMLRKHVLDSLSLQPYLRGERLADVGTGAGFPGLALQVQEVLRRDPLGGHLFCFRGRRGDLMKVIWHDGQGACLFTKRLERGRFLWPSPADGVVTISSAQMGYLLSGIDWRHPQETWRPSSVG